MTPHSWTGYSERNDAPPLAAELEKMQRRMFPDSQRLVQCDSQHILGLLALLTAERSMSLNPDYAAQITTEQRCSIIHDLIMRQPFHFYDQNSPLTIRRYLLLLAEAFRGFANRVDNRGIVLHADVHKQWYGGVNILYGRFTVARLARSPEFQIEVWDSMFLFKHIQYLLLSIPDSHTGGRRFVEFGGRIAKSALQGYGGQYVEALDSLKVAVSRKHKREPWHDRYLESEENFFSASYGTDEDGVASAEREAVIALRNEIERVLLEHGTKRLNIKQGFKFLGARVGQSFQSAGPSEDNAHYYQYGLLDLLYRGSFKIRNRQVCFTEMIGAVRRILERSFCQRLHRKAIDLYRHLAELGISHRVIYGDPEERDAIDRWINQFQAGASKDNSKR